MKLTFADIGTAKNRYTLQDERWHPDRETTFTSPPEVEFTVFRTSDDSAELQGNLQGCLEIACNRCGEPVSYELNEDFYYLVTTRQESVSELPEKECSDEECNMLFLEEAVIDVTEILREQIYLSLPGKVLCDEQCRGVCPGCGHSLNREKCTCSEFKSDSPFAVLKQLKQK